MKYRSKRIIKQFDLCSIIYKPIIIQISAEDFKTHGNSPLMQTCYLHKFWRCIDDDASQDVANGGSLQAHLLNQH